MIIMANTTVVLSSLAGPDSDFSESGPARLSFVYMGD